MVSITYIELFTLVLVFSFSIFIMIGMIQSKDCERLSENTFNLSICLFIIGSSLYSLFFLRRTVLYLTLSTCQFTILFLLFFWASIAFLLLITYYLKKIIIHNMYCDLFDEYEKLEIILNINNTTKYVAHSSINYYANFIMLSLIWYIFFPTFYCFAAYE